MTRLFSSYRFAIWLSLWLIAPLCAADNPRLLVLGDSLSAAYGIEVQQGWVSLLEQRVAAKYPHKVINASVSGETTGGGLARLPALLDQHKPELVIVELGGNDGLRGYPLNTMKQQMARIIETSRAAGAEVLLVGMQIPPNYGPRYTNQFRDTYMELAQQYDLPLVEFLLAEVALNAKLMQKDGIHPTAEAQEKILDNVWPVLQPLLVRE
jgi:Lysophospholipase L1 and related esterases